MAKYMTEYRQGRKKNFFLRDENGTYFLDKITKGCGFTVICGSEEKVMNYINDNGFTEVGLIRIA